MNLSTAIKEKLNIVDFLRKDGLELKSESGGRYSCRCPFHNEKTPSFKVSETFQNFKCFGCGERGDVIYYFAKRNVLDYKTAQLELAKQLGIKTDNFKVDSKITEYFRINKLLEDYYKQSFNELADKHPAKKQIIDRGLKITDDFGYAPSSPNAVIDYLKHNNISQEDMLELGIITEKGNILLRDRLIFFIRNYMGKTIGFSGRTLGSTDNGFKYVNSKTSKIYDKQYSLYNIEKAKDKARKENVIYIVEGQFDVIAMKQNGYENVVAISGSAFTKKHIKELFRCIDDTGKIILLLDGDTAGKKATLKIFQEFPEIHKNLYVIRIPNKQDPCEYLQHTKKLPQEKLLLPLLYNAIKKRRPLTILENRQLFIDELQEEFTQYIKDKLLKEQYLRNSCITIGIDYRNLKVKTKKERKEITENTEQPTQEISKEDNYYLSSIAYYIANRDLLLEPLNVELYPPKYRTFIDEINQYKGKTFIPEKFKKQKLAQIISEYQAETFTTDKLARNHINMLLKQAHKLSKKQNEQQLLSNIVSNLDGLTPEEIVNVLQTMEFK